jgi:putative MATE family efflux protein
VLDVSAEDITEGPLLRALLLLAAPLLAQNAVRVVEQLADVFFLGRASGDAVAAASLGLPLVHVLFALAVFTPMVGTQVVVSQRVGGADTTGGARGLTAGVAVALALSLAVGVAGYVGARPLVDLLTTLRPRTGGGPVPELAASYIRVYALGLPLLAVGDTIEGAFLGWGDSRAPLAMNVLSVVTSVALDPVFIFGIDLGPVAVPALGVRGAALSAVVGAGLSLTLAVGLLRAGRHEGMLDVPRATGAVLATAREIVDVGGPNAAQQLAKQTARVAVVVVVFAAGGAAALAAYFVGARVAAVAYIPALGLKQAAQSVVGQNLGAAAPARARRATRLGAAVTGTGLAVVSLVQWVLADGIVALLIPAAGAPTVELSVAYLGILAIGYPAIGVAYLYEAGFNGARRTRTSFVATLCQFWVVRLPLAAGLAFGLGLGAVGVYWAVTLSNVVAAAGLAAYYRYETDGGMLDRAAAAAGEGPAGSDVA